MREGVRPNPKKDKEARRRERPGYRRLRADFIQTYDEKGKKQYKKI